MDQWNRTQLSKLATKYFQGTATDTEKLQLMEWYNAFDEQDLTVTIPAEEGEDEASTEQKMLLRLQQTIQQDTPAVPGRKRMVSFLQYGIAAALLTVGVGIFLFTRHAPAPPIAKVARTTLPDVKPGGNKATLTLADGTVIVLDSAGNGTLGHQGQTAILKKKDGQLVYDASAVPPQAAVAFNTITTPRGGQYHIILPDGSKVWLNASSSLHFPTAFRDVNRNVVLKGEAYFEVAKDAAHPFHVMVSENMKIAVLGTGFNVMAYADEPSIKTTLIDGSIHIYTSNPNATPAAIQRSVILNPSQQATVTARGDLKVLNDVNTEEVLAWKNGRFEFNETDIQTMMRQIARWYNINVVYTGKVSDEKFTGEIPRNSNISEVFKILQLSNIHFTMDGNTITITS